MMKTALTIAGSDSGGGAGIQADIKTMTAHGVYAMSAITALTAQNTMGIEQISGESPDFLKAQLDCIFTDIDPDAVKVGMVSDASLIRVIAAALKKYQAKNIVLDPVMASTSGSSLMKEDALQVFSEELMPLATVITPNIPEAQILSGLEIQCESDMEKAAGQMGRQYGCSILLKGGHALGDANDLLWKEETVTWFYGKRIENPNCHGTGCTLSSAVAANLARGKSLEAAVKDAKAYLTAALSAMLDLGKGNRPLNHMVFIPEIKSWKRQEENSVWLCSDTETGIADQGL